MNCSKCNSELPDIDGLVFCYCGQINKKKEEIHIAVKDETKVQFPSITKQATNLISSSVNHIKTGMKTVSEEVKKERLDICNSCEHYKNNRCAQCGCFMDIKAGWAEQKCPIDKWSDYKKKDNVESVLDIQFFPTNAAPFLTENDLIRDTHILLSKISHLKINKIVGVPRSGMIPATYLSIKLGVPLFSFKEDDFIDIGSGLRMRNHEEKKGYTLVVEDSCATGTSINKVRSNFPDRSDILYTSVYTTPRSSKFLDYYGRFLPLPHWFSWHMFGYSYMFEKVKMGTDFDGVLCFDCPIEKDDDGELYLEWMKNVSPLHFFRYSPIPFIITARLERYRKETEDWLNKHQFKYGELIMGPWKDKEERSKHCTGSWKREVAQRIDCKTFIESNDMQAKIISKKWDHPVISIDGKVVYCRGEGVEWPNGIEPF